MTRYTIRAALGLLALGLCAGAAMAAPGATAAMKLAGGADAGTATFEDGPTGVLIHLDVHGIKPGWHAIHMHEKGDCSDAKFASAGGHMNMAPVKRPHGLLNPDGPDLGDLPNVYASEAGVVKAEVFSPYIALKGSGGRAKVLDADGSALVMHENPDDYVSQPVGGAGARVACGVVTAVP